MSYFCLLIYNFLVNNVMYALFVYFVLRKIYLLLGFKRFLSLKQFKLKKVWKNL